MDYVIKVSISEFYDGGIWSPGSEKARNMQICPIKLIKGEDFSYPEESLLKFRIERSKST